MLPGQRSMTKLAVSGAQLVAEVVKVDKEAMMIVLASSMAPIASRYATRRWALSYPAMSMAISRSSQDSGSADPERPRPARRVSG